MSSKIFFFASLKLCFAYAYFLKNFHLYLSIYLSIYLSMLIEVMLEIKIDLEPGI